MDLEHLGGSCYSKTLDSSKFYLDQLYIFEWVTISEFDLVSDRDVVLHDHSGLIRFIGVIDDAYFFLQTITVFRNELSKFSPAEAPEEMAS
jgi:hypothetical protein